MNHLGNKEIMAKNIQRYMDKYGVDRRKLSNDLDIRYTTLTDWLKAKTYPRIDKIELLANYFSVSKSDLVEEFKPSSTLSKVTETTARLSEDRKVFVLETAQSQLQEQLEERKQEGVSDFQKKEKIPTVHNSASAANPTELVYGDTVVEEEEFEKVPESADFAVPINGDSMEPKIKNGQFVFVKKQPDIEDGEIAIVELDGDGVTCKEIYKDYENKTIILRSINKLYEDRIVSPNQIRIIGKVVF